MEKLKNIADYWKKVNKIAVDRKEQLLTSIKEQEEFHENFTTCMTKLRGLSESLSDETDGAEDLEDLGGTVEKVFQAGQNILAQATAAQKPLISERIQTLSDTWSGVRQLKKQASAVQVQIAVTEEKAQEVRKQSKAYGMELEKFNKWLDNAEAVLKTDMYSVPEDKQMDEIHKHEQLYTELQQNALVVNDLMEHGRRISSNVPDSERAQIKNDLETLSVRWTNIKKLSDSYGSQMEECIAEQASYYNELEKCVEWMQEAGAAIALFELDVNDEDAIRDELRNHLDLCEEIRNRQAAITSVLEKGKGLVCKLPPEERNVIKEQLSRLEEEWIKLQEQANDKKEELKECLGEADEDENVPDFQPEVLKVKKELKDRLQWVKCVMKSCEEGKNDNARTAVGSDKVVIESLIENAETICDKLNGPEKESVREELDALKRDWVALTGLLNGRRRRLGRQGSELESKKMMFAVHFAQLQNILNDLQSNPIQILPIEAKHLDQALSDIDEAKNILAEGEQNFEKLLQMNSELSSLEEGETVDDAANINNESLLNGLKKELDDLILLYDNKRPVVERVRKVDTKLNTLDSKISAAKERFNEITSADNEPGQELLNLEALLQDVELNEAELATVDSESKNLMDELGDVGQSLSSRNYDLFEKLQKFKSEVHKAIEENRISISENAALDEELQSCLVLISHAEIEANKEIQGLEIPIVEQQVVQVQGALLSSENATASLFQKSETMLEKLKPHQKKAKQEQLTQLQRTLEGVKEKVKTNADVLQSKVGGKEDYVKQYSDCVEWLNNIEKDLASNLQEDQNISMSEKLDKWNSTLDVLNAEASPMNVLSHDAPNLISALSDAEKDKIQAELDDLRTRTNKVKEDIQSKIDIENNVSSEMSALEDKVETMITWLQAKESESTKIMSEVNHDSLPQSLQNMKIINSDLESKQDELNQIMATGKGCENAQLRKQVLFLSDLYDTNIRTIKEMCKLLEEQEAAVNAFDKLLSRCKTVVSKLDQLNSDEIPLFETVEELQQYLDERIKNFSEIVQQGDCIANVEVTKAAIECSSLKELKEYADIQQQEVIDKWESLQVQFTERVLEIRTNLAAQHELSSSFSEVSSWIESTEEEISSLKQPVDKIEDMSDSFQKLQSLNKETLSYDNFVESLKHKVDTGSVDLNSSFKESNENEVSRLHDKISNLQDEISQKLSEVEGCLKSVQDASNCVNECKQWLHDKKELFPAELPVLFDDDDARRKLDEYQNLNSEITSLIKNLYQGKEQIEKQLQNVSPVLRESLMSDIENISKNLEELENQLQSHMSDIEGRIINNNEVNDSISGLGQWLDKAEQLCMESKEEHPDVILEGLEILLHEIPVKESELNKILEGSKSLYQEHVFKINDLRKRLEGVSQSLPQRLNSCRSEVEEIKNENQKLESCNEWVNQATALLSCEIPFDFDEITEEMDEDQISKFKNIKTELPLYEEMVNSLLNSETRKDDNTKDQFKNLEAQIQKTKENVMKNEERSNRYKNNKADFSSQFEKCSTLLAQANIDNDATFSLAPDVAISNLEDQRRRVENIKAVESQLQALEETRLVMSEDQNPLQKDKTDVQMSVLKDKWCNSLENASRKQEELESWYSQVQEVSKKMNECKDSIDAVAVATNTMDDQKDLTSTNKALGSLTSSQDQLENAGNNLKSLKETKQLLMSRLSEDEQQRFCDQLNDLDSQSKNVSDKITREIAKAEERINDLVKFDEDSAYCESMLTIYKAVMPAELSCTAETLDDQIEKLKRLEADMNERESHMIAFKEHAFKLSKDGDNEDSRRAHQLLDEWATLKRQLNNKRKELDGLSEATSDFQHEYAQHTSNVNALEEAIGEDQTGPINERINKTQEILSKFEKYECELSELSDRSRAIPPVAYEQEDDPSTKINILKNRWHKSKEKVLEKLTKLENQKTDQQNLGKEMSEIENWINQVHLSNDNAPTYDATEDPFETALLETMSLECALDERALQIDRLLVKAHEIKDDESQKSDDLKQLGLLTQKLDKEKEAAKKKMEVIHGYIQQLNLAEEDIGNCRFVIDDTSNSLNTDVVIDDEGLMSEKLESFKEKLSKLEACDSQLQSTAHTIEQLKNLCSISDELHFENELKETRNELGSAQELLKKKINQVESISDFERQCQKHLSFCREMCSELLPEDKSNETLNLAAAKDRLEDCRNFAVKVNEKDTTYQDILSKGKEILSDLPSESKMLIQEWIDKLEANRNDLKEKLSTECENLQSIVAREQSVDEWLDDTATLMENGAELLNTSSSFTSSIDESKISKLQAMITKLKDQRAVGENLDAETSPNVSKAIEDISKIQTQLAEAEEHLKKMLQLNNNFEEKNRVIEEHLQECQVEKPSPETLEEGTFQIDEIKVSP